MPPERERQTKIIFKELERIVSGRVTLNGPNAVMKIVPVI